MTTADILGALILVADDDADSRTILSRRLIRRGYRTVEAQDGRSALDALSANAFDLVLLDHVMPWLSGLEVLVEIRKQHSSQQLPVIMVTGKIFAEDVAEAMAQGADDHVTKPVDFSAALIAIEKQLARKAQARPYERPSLVGHHR